MNIELQNIRKTRIRKMIKKLKHMYPKANMMLTYSNNWELLVAVMLSAQCRDKMVNRVTKKLFAKYQTIEDYINADPKEFEKDIFQTGFYKSKTKHVLATARIIHNKHQDIIPTSIKELTQLPGVARKTANVVLGNAYGIVEGIAVDTHVKRFAIKHNLTDHTAPEKIEQDLMKIIPKKDWFHFTYLAIEYGRNQCPARKHKHELCPLTSM